MIQLYFDEDSMDNALLNGLDARGADFMTALEAGMIGRSDMEHLDYATAQGRVLCSFNMGDFLRLHKKYLTQGKRHCGIILAKQQEYSVGEYMRRLLRLIANKSPEEMENCIEFLSDWGEERDMFD